MNTADFQSLVHKHLDDVMSPRERDVLEQRLLVSPGARAEFWRIAKQHAALSAWGELKETAPFFKPLPTSRLRLWWTVGALALVALAVCAGVAEYIHRSEMARRASVQQVSVAEAHQDATKDQADEAATASGGSGTGTVVVQVRDPKKGHGAVAGDSATGAKTGPAPEFRRNAADTGRTGDDGSSEGSTLNKAKRAESQKHLQDALSHVSPEGRKILDQIRPQHNSPLPAESPQTPELLSAELLVARPGYDKGGGVSAPLAPGSSGAEPLPMNPAAPATRKQSLPGSVVDSGNGFFDSNTGFGVFVDDVVLNHTAFHLTADELEVFMLPESSAAAVLPVKNGLGGNLKTAIARGRKVIITKPAADGEIQTGCGREAVYDGATGDMILRGWPQIQKRNNLTVATEPGTYFIIKADGRFFAAGGRAQTRIVPESPK